MHAHVRLRLPDGTVASLVPGDLIGRLTTAALHLSDARISEAHAMVSLRGKDLKLLALRGMFAVAGRPVNEVTLTPGLDVEMAPGLGLHVVDVALPERVLAIDVGGELRQVLAGTTSLVLEPAPALVPRYRATASAHIWNTGQAWVLQTRDGAARREPALELHEGDVFDIEGVTVSAVAVPLARLAQGATQLEGALRRPLTLVARYDTAHILQDGQPALALDGIAARIVSELVAVDGPVGWAVLAGEIWPKEPDRIALRRKWDVNLNRLRRKLRGAGVRTDLVRAGGRGTVELLLYGDDRVQDHT